ncbi:MAG: SDR family NAD(P)-dependent oxidoreductase, partial [Candidatus Omnitrophota bacterium]
KGYEINPTLRKDYDELFDELRLQDMVPQNIVHLWCVTRENQGESGSMEKHQSGGFYSLLFLGQALGRQYGETRFYLKVVSNHMQEVTGEEVLHPGKAALLGPVKVIGQEYPNISCQSIDIDVSDLESRNSRETRDRLLAELTTRSSDTMIAYRGKYRWVQTFHPFRLPSGEKVQTGMREKGVYLITGGLGGIGLLFAEHFAKKARARLILTGRSALPPRHAWEQWLADHAAEDGVGLKIRNILALETLGAEVLVLSADAADQRQMQEAVIQAKERFGTIHGVIHAAGITGGASFCAIEETTEEACREQFRPKIQGTMVLESVLEGTDLDFCILMSSLSSVLGGLQFVSYAAANLFMDAFVSRHNRGNNVPWISVNWDGWQLDDQHTDPSTATSAGAKIAELTLTPEEGMAAFQSILSLVGKTNQIVVSTSDLQKRIEQWIRMDPLEEQPCSEKSGLSSSHKRPTLSSVYMEPRTDIERKMTHIWENVLGLSPVGVQDNFFELGGHSLLGTQVISRLRQTFQVEINIRNLFDEPTVAGLSERIEKIRFENQNRRSGVPEEREEIVL